MDGDVTTITILGAECADYRATSHVYVIHITSQRVLWYSVELVHSQPLTQPVSLTVQAWAKADLWWIGSPILVAISLLGFGRILWDYFGALLR